MNDITKDEFYSRESCGLTDFIPVRRKIDAQVQCQISANISGKSFMKVHYLIKTIVHNQICNALLGTL